MNSKFLKDIKSLFAEEEGLTMTEYAVIGAVVVIVAIVGFSSLGTAVNDKMSTIASTISATGGSSTSGSSTSGG